MTPPPARPDHEHPLALARAAVAALAPLALLALAAPLVRLPPVASELLRFTAASAAIVLAGTTVPSATLSRPRVALPALASGLALCALALALPAVPSGLSGSLGLMTVACTLGVAVGSRIGSAGHLLAVALVSAAVDLWSVTSPSGPTHQIVQRPALMRLLTVSVASLPDRAPEPIIGFGDVVFVALYASACARFGLSRLRTTAALSLGLLSAGALAITLSRAVPALPGLGLAVVLAHPESRRVPREDRAATWGSAALLAASALRALLR